MTQATAAARCITQEAFEAGVKTLRASVKSNALKHKWLQLIDWDNAEQSWNLFQVLRESSGCDKEGLRLWTQYFVNNAIGFQLETREFVLHLLLISFTKVETARGRRSGVTKDAIKKKKQIVKRTSDNFFFDAAEEDKRLVRVLWNLRKYFHVDIADSNAHGLTTIYHECLSSVSDWSDDDQVSSFLSSIRPANKSASGASPKRKRTKPVRNPKTGAKGKNIVKSEPSWSSDSELDHSYFSSEESSAQEIAAGLPSYTEQPAEYMVVEKYENQPEPIFSNDPSVLAFAQAFMMSGPRTYSYAEVAQRSLETINYLFTNGPERIQGFMDCLDAFFNPASTSLDVNSGNFVY
jgi:hypothetical protein